MIDTIRSCPECDCKDITFAFTVLKEHDPNNIHLYGKKEHKVHCANCKLRCPTNCASLLVMQQTWNEFCLDYKFAKIFRILEELSEKLK